MIAITDAAAMEQIARQAIAAMPELFRQHLDGVSVHVEEFADAETLDDLGIESPWGLLGVYQGRPLTEQSVWDSGMLSPRIRLFRRPLLAEWSRTGEDLHDLIVHVLVHEVGHHFGYSDEEMEAIDEGED
ncbi:MAG: metallopeptidase family protein [Sphingobium sp.]|nr:metallopeptidase family protein [Sphingobium sp.]